MARAQALAIPERIASLILTSTKCGDRRELPSKTSVVLFAKLLTGMASTPEQVVPLVMDSLFLKAFLDSPDPDNDGKPRREGVQKVRFPVEEVMEGSTNPDSSLRCPGLPLPH